MNTAQKTKRSLMENFIFYVGETDTQKCFDQEMVWNILYDSQEHNRDRVTSSESYRLQACNYLHLKVNWNNNYWNYKIEMTIIETTRLFSEYSHWIGLLNSHGTIWNTLLEWNTLHGIGLLYCVQYWKICDD